jgi:7-cyano-7-deazaguanine synthase
MHKRDGAVILLSGGLDSATCLYWARARGWRLTALNVHYGQRHAREARSALALARAAGAKLVQVRLKLPWLKASSLVDPGKKLPNLPLSKIGRGGIPSTYVPGRNTILLSLAVSLAETEMATQVIIGSNSLDYSGYPDCRPKFNHAFERVAGLGTKAGTEDRGVSITAPLIRMDKAAIVRLAVRLGVPLRHTWSCYQGGARPCGVCDSCKLRAKGFAEAEVLDPVAQR